MVPMGFTSGHGPIKRVVEAIKNGLSAVRSKVSRKQV